MLLKVTNGVVQRTQRKKCIYTVTRIKHNFGVKFFHFFRKHLLLKYFYTFRHVNIFFLSRLNDLIGDPAVKIINGTAELKAGFSGDVKCLSRYVMSLCKQAYEKGA